MRQIVFTNRANTDIDDIWEYTATTWSKDQAYVYNESIEQACIKLADNTQSGVDASHIRQGIRAFIVGKHTIYFTSTSETLTIIRVLHQSMDVDTQLG